MQGGLNDVDQPAVAVASVGTRDLDLPYLPDRLHLTPAGHEELGAVVAQRVAGLDLSTPGAGDGDYPHEPL